LQIVDATPRCNQTPALPVSSAGTVRRYAMKFRPRVMLFVPLGIAVAACGATVREFKSPDVRLQEGENKLEDIRRFGGGEGTQLAAEVVYDDLAEAADDKQSQLTAMAAGESADVSQHRAAHPTLGE
jgi:tRNA G37 N-methylase TrmD